MKAPIGKLVLGLVAAAVVLSWTTQSADAFWHHRRGATTAYYLPAAPVTVGYAPVVVARPIYVPTAPVVTAGYAPVTSYYAPAPVTSYYAPAPVTSYYAPAAPVTSYYAPAAPVTTYYAPAAPVTSYYAPAAPIVVQRPIYWP